MSAAVAASAPRAIDATIGWACTFRLETTDIPSDGQVVIQVHAVPLSAAGPLWLGPASLHARLIDAVSDEELLSNVVDDPAPCQALAAGQVGDVILCLPLAHWPVEPARTYRLRLVYDLRLAGIAAATPVLDWDADDRHFTVLPLSER